MYAAYAMAIISCIVRANLLTLLSRTALGLSVFGLVTTLLAWAIVAGTSYAKRCNEAALSDSRDTKLDVGFTLLIVTWILMVVDAVLAVTTVNAQIVASFMAQSNCESAAVLLAKHTGFPLDDY